MKQVLAQSAQKTRQRLNAQGYVETFPGLWELPAATHELLSKDTPVKTTMAMEEAR